MSVADKITRLQNAKEAIATAITTKGGTVSTGDGFEDFADDIGTISGGGGGIPEGLLTGDATPTFTVTIPDGTTKLRDYCFNLCFGLTSITIPNSVTSIGTRCFGSCISLTSITISNSVTSLKNSCFSGCTNLTSITIPDSVTSLEANCFQSCTNLTSITIPNGVTSIGNNCFYACESLTSITFKPTTPPTVSNANAWGRVPTTCIIRVPRGSLQAYTTATNYPNSSTYTYEEYDVE